ncbi:MAG: WD40 repeat domain-containing protein [Armatimonadota bacterium]
MLCDHDRSESLETAAPRLVLGTGHESGVDALAFSPCGKLLATGDRDGRILLWDVPTGELLLQLPGHDEVVKQLVFSPDGAYLASSSLWKVGLWDLADGSLVRVLPDSGDPVAYPSPDQILAVHEGKVKWLDPRTGAELRRLSLDTHGKAPLYVLVSADGRVAASFILIGESLVLPSGQGIFRGHHELQVWDLERGERVGRYQPSERYRRTEACECCGKPRTVTGRGVGTTLLAISADGRRVALGGHLSLAVWDTRRGRRSHLLLCERDGARSAAFSSDGRLLAAGTLRGRVMVWRLGSGTLLCDTIAHTPWVSGVALSPDGTLVASGGLDSAVRLSSAVTGELLQSHPGAEYEALAVEFTPSGDTLLSTHADGTVRCWDPATGALQRTDVDGPCRLMRSGLAISANGRWSAHVWGGKILERERETPFSGLHVRELPSGELLQVINGESYPGWSVAFSSALGILFCCGTYLNAWDLDTGTLRYQLDAEKIAVSPDGLLLATNVGAKPIFIRDAATGEVIRQMEAPEVPDWMASLRFSPDGKWLLGGFLGFGVGLWEVATGRIDWEVGTHADGVSYTAFSPDGSRVAVGGSYDPRIVIWDLAARRERLTLEGHSGAIRGVSFAPDGDTLVSAATDGTVRLWDSQTGNLLVTLRVVGGAPGEPSDEWLAHTPDGYYACSPGADRILKWQVGGQLLPPAAYRDRLQRPDRVAAALASARRAT